MKLIQLSAIALCLLSLASCNDTGDAQQSQVASSPQAVASAATSASAPASTSAQPSAAAPATAQALPEPITAFINKHFAGATVVSVENDSEFAGVECEVRLNDGTEIDFDAKNQWKKIDCKTKAVPAALVPTAIANYVKANYKSIAITKVDNNGYGYEVELANGMDLKFGQNGQFVGIDD